MGPDITEIIAIGTAVVAILATAMFPLNVWLRNRERQRDRELLLELTREKLRVLETAITLGYDEARLAELDRRLQRLVGSEEFLRLVENIRIEEQGKSSGVVISAKLKSSDLDGGSAAAQQSGSIREG